MNRYASESLRHLKKVLARAEAKQKKRKADGSTACNFGRLLTLQQTADSRLRALQRLSHRARSSRKATKLGSLLFVDAVDRTCLDSDVWSHEGVTLAENQQARCTAVLAQSDFHACLSAGGGAD